METEEITIKYEGDEFSFNVEQQCKLTHG